MDHLRRGGQFVPFKRVDIDDDDVPRQVRGIQREKRRIAGIAPVPERLAPARFRILHLDRLKQRRQTGRGEDRVRRDLFFLEDADLAVAHFGRADKQPRSRRLADMFVIKRLDDIAQRVAIERAVDIGRHDLRHRRAEHDRPAIGHRLTKCPHAKGGHPAVQMQVPDTGDPVPQPIQIIARGLMPALDQPRLQCSAVQCASRCAGNTADLKLWLFQQPVKHAPGIGPMRAAAL